MLLHEVTGRQLRDARQALGFSLSRLGRACRFRRGINAVQRLPASHGEPPRARFVLIICAGGQPSQRSLSPTPIGHPCGRRPRPLAITAQSTIRLGRHRSSRQPVQHRSVEWVSQGGFEESIAHGNLVLLAAVGTLNPERLFPRQLEAFRIHMNSRGSLAVSLRASE